MKRASSQLKANRVLKLPPSARKIIDHYLNLSLGNKRVPAPYYINEDYLKPTFKDGQVISSGELLYKKRLTKNRTLIGKGSAIEIENLTTLLAKKEHFDLKSASIPEIRRFMAVHGIGIDCSGLVVWAINEVIRLKTGKSLWQFIDFGRRNIFRKFLIRFRPIENISVRVLVHPTNSRVLQDLVDLQVGDLIITWNNQHVILITEIGFDAGDRPMYFKYVNSTWWYAEKGGIKGGEVYIKDPRAPLTSQDWSESLYKGKNWTFEGVKDNGKVIRLFALER